MPNDPSSRDPGRKALGRGLAALIPGGAPAAPSPGLRVLPIEKIRPNASQPRKHFEAQALDELVASIKEQGILQPIVVRKLGDGYEIVAGERRWRAATRAGLQEVPAVVKELTDSAALQAALVENIQRADLDPLEEAEAYARLIRDHDLTQEQVGQAVGKSRAAIANALRLLKLPEPVLEMLGDGRLTAGHARALMTLPTEGDILKLADDLVTRGASVREAEARARMIARSSKAARAKKAKGAPKAPADTTLEERLTRALQTRVTLHHRKGKGRIEIHFHSFEHLDSLLERMGV